MSRLRHVYRAQEGAVFIQIGIAIFVLMAFNVFVLDYAVMWLARGQAQNAADAAALAGAIARSYDDLDDPPAADGNAVSIATTVASTNLIWQAPGTPTVTFDCPSGVTGRCTRVDITRTINTLFGSILEVDTQSVRATATAISATGNGVRCLRPIAVPDTWVELTSNDSFEFYQTGTGTPLPAGSRDDYAAPSDTVPGQTVLPDYLGERIIWSFGQPITNPIIRTGRDPSNAITFMLTLDLPGGTFADNMTACASQPVAIGQSIRVVQQASTTVEDLLDAIISQDPDADWNDPQRRAEGGCAPACAAVSPRIIPIALFDPQRFQLGRNTTWTNPAVGCPTSDPCIKVTNIVGFFVHGSFGGYNRHGHFQRYPGSTLSVIPGTGTAPVDLVEEASWLKSQRLIR